MLKKQAGNMYDFVSHTWNPIRGRCLHKCSYCYMLKFKLDPIRLVKKELNTNLSKDNFIFIGSGTDMWARDVPSEWIEKVLEHTRRYPDNRYLFQSKNPNRFNEFLGTLGYKYIIADPQYINQFPPNVVFGTTIESNRKHGISEAPPYSERAKVLGELRDRGFETMVTLEPILEFDLDELVEIVKTAKPVWINIGADSKGHGLPEPPAEKIQELIDTLMKETDVKLKNNLKRIMGVK